MIIQTSPIKVDWTVLPISVIAVAALVFLGVWAADKLGLNKKLRTFAEEGEMFWDKLRMVVREEIQKEHDEDHHRHNRT